MRLDVYRLDQGRIYLDEDETPKETLTDNTKQHQTVPGHIFVWQIFVYQFSDKTDELNITKPNLT